MYVYVCIVKKAFVLRFWKKNFQLESRTRAKIQRSFFFIVDQTIITDNNRKPITFTANFCRFACSIVLIFRYHIITLVHLRRTNHTFQSNLQGKRSNGNDPPQMQISLVVQYSFSIHYKSFITSMTSPIFFYFTSFSFNLYVNLYSSKSTFFF